MLEVVPRQRCIGPFFRKFAVSTNTDIFGKYNTIKYYVRKIQKSMDFGKHETVLKSTLFSIFSAKNISSIILRAAAVEPPRDSSISRPRDLEHEKIKIQYTLAIQ